MKYSARLLALAGIVGILFAWATDPRWGFGGSGNNLIDDSHDMAVGTVVAMIGSAGVLLTGLWLMTRRRV